MGKWVSIGVVLLGCAGCVQVVAAAAVSGSDQGASGRERKFAQLQKGEAYERDRELLKTTDPAACSAGKRPAFERFVEAARRDTEHTLTPEVTLAEANEWTDTLRSTLKLQQKLCRAPDAPPAPTSTVPVVVLEEDPTPPASNVPTDADAGVPSGWVEQRAAP